MIDKKAVKLEINKIKQILQEYQAENLRNKPAAQIYMQRLRGSRDALEDLLFQRDYNTEEQNTELNLAQGYFDAYVKYNPEWEDTEPESYLVRESAKPDGLPDDLLDTLMRIAKVQGYLEQIEKNKNFEMLLNPKPAMTTARQSEASQIYG